MQRPSDLGIMILSHGKFGLAAPNLRLRETCARTQTIHIGLAFLRPLQHEMATEEMGMLQRAERSFGVSSRSKVEESESTGLVVELARKTDRLELAVGTTPTKENEG